MQKRATSMMNGLGYLSHKEKLKKIGLFIL